MSVSFTKMATVTASTMRPGARVGGLTGDLAVSIASLACTPLDPVTPEVAQMAGLGEFVEVLQTMTQGGLDIQVGDTFIVGTTHYTVRAVAEWNWKPDGSDNLTVFLGEIQ